MSRERQQRKQEEIRNAILDAARDIISREGVNGLSIRKITSAIEYSPSIIYHYFKDKNEIIETLVNEGYEKILDSVSEVTRNEKEPEKEIIELFTSYIKAALKAKDEYKAFMLNDDPSVLQRTAILEKGISTRSRTMQVLCEIIQRGVRLQRFTACDPELTAQVMWTSAFGLIIKLILEKSVSEEQIHRLLEQQFNIIFNGIMVRKEVN